MNKTELIKRVSEKTGMTKKASADVLAAVLETIEEALVRGDRVQLVGFGTFEVRNRKARLGRNPQKPDEVMEIPASKAPVFKAGKGLKELVNKKKK
ncbi:MAG: HU family DNA-binding protein [Tissierellia bacterium]|jgi:DNA-binding protein HU-beta|nr:HU family DNA-binding protein [Bacillota bacterium]NLL22154.1 HU family DNA-binding protein [Tissierellia bacterium]